MGGRHVPASRQVMCLVTCFVASALTASSKIKGLPYCQLRKMGVCLIDVCSCPLWDKLAEGVSIVCDLAMHLHTIAGLHCCTHIHCCSSNFLEVSKPLPYTLGWSCSS